MDDDRHYVGPFEAPDTYQLIEVLGQGGEGSVWIAQVNLSDGGLTRVAVKILPPADTDDRDRWSRYSHLLRNLDHPGIVRVVDVFLGPRRHRRGTLTTTTTADALDESTPGDPASAVAAYRYVVMRLVEGVTLQEWLNENPDATVSERLRSLRMVAAALDEMHSGEHTGIPVAHGDVKPGNIVRRPDGSTVLVDLGLTRITDDLGRSGRTRAYAAPELFQQGAMATPDSDRFAFVATATHLLLGQPAPMAAGYGPDLAATHMALANHPLTATRPDLVQAVLDALGAPPGGRPSPLSAWLAALTGALSTTTQSLDRDVTPTVPTPGRPKRSRRPLVVRIGVGVAVVAIAVVGAVVALDPFGDRDNGLSDASANPPPTSTSAPPSLTPSPTPTPSSSAGPTAQGSLVGTLIAGPDARETGIIVTRTENAVLGMNIEADDFAINGTPVTYGWVASCKLGCGATEESYVELNLSRRFSTLDATFGISDSSSGKGPLKIQIVSLDGGESRVLFSDEFEIGTGYHQQVDVSGILRLKVSFIGALGSTRGALGDPTLFA